MNAARLIGAAAALAALGCSDLQLYPAASYIQTPIADPSFRNDIMPVLRETCGSSGACHGGATPIFGLNLEVDSLAYVSLVNHPSTSRPLLRVKPGVADSSFLYLVLRDTAAIRMGYYRMPLTQYALPFPTRETIKNWINMGAKNN